MDNLNQDDQLMAIRAETVNLIQQQHRQTAPGTPQRTGGDDDLPGAAQLRALCPAISPAVSAVPPASPYLTHAEKEIRRLKAELGVARQSLKDLSGSRQPPTAEGGADSENAVEARLNAAVEARMAEVRLECEEQWADHFAEQSIEADNTIDQLRGDLASALAKVADIDAATEQLRRVQAAKQEQQELVMAQATELESRTARVEILTAELRRAEAILEAEREVRAELLAEATGLREEVAELKAEKRNNPPSSSSAAGIQVLEERDPNQEYATTGGGGGGGGGCVRCTHQSRIPRQLLCLQSRIDCSMTAANECLASACTLATCIVASSLTNALSWVLLAGEKEEMV